MTVEGMKRTKGRPKLTWAEVVRKDMGACNLTADMALDRVGWPNRILSVSVKGCIIFYFTVLFGIISHNN